MCKEVGINQTELADKIGLSRVGLSKAINGNPTVDTLERIATALNVDITDLFKKNDSGEDVNGYIKAKGTVYEIHSFDDLEKVLRLKED
ncbi:XRE family transcriptional regulator [Bacteroides ovatus]|nr:XRE family transcriptional regulator [Bacteroides ovatus]